MRAHEVVVKYLEKQLSAGLLTLDSRLPSERELAEKLQVGRSSVREAIRVLEAMGVIRTAAGSGPSAGAFVVAEPTAAIASTFRMHLATSHWPVSEVIEMRVMLESWAVSSAAELEPDADRKVEALKRARDLIDRMSQPHIDREAFHVLDAQFHACFIHATNNSLIEATMNGLRGAINDYVIMTIMARDDWPQVAQRLVEEHWDIFRQVEAGDASLAQHSCRAHIEGFYRDFVTTSAR